MASKTATAIAVATANDTTQKRVNRIVAARINGEKTGKVANTGLHMGGQFAMGFATQAIRPLTSEEKHLIDTHPQIIELRK